MTGADVPPFLQAPSLSQSGLTAVSLGKNVEEFLPDLNDHPDFFVPFSSYKPKKLYFDHVAAQLPKNWRLNQDYFWTYAVSPSAKSITQGWKIHVSAIHDSSRAVLDAVVQVCTAHATEFKFASDPFILRKLISKNAARQAGGKFVTIYPQSIAVFEQILEALYLRLKDEQGPYILSDRRYKDSNVVFYRYGGFRSFSEQNVLGKTRSMYLNDRFEFIEDERVPRFNVPDFVSDGKWGLIEMDAADADDEADTGNSHFGGRYDINAVIKYTNAGGIYTASDAGNGDAVVIKEARPFVGTDQGGLDAIGRLRKEHRILEKIKDEAIAPAPRSWFEEWEHSFLAQEFIKGQSLRDYCVHATRVIYPGGSDAETRVWMDKLVTISRDLIRKIDRLHAHNIIFGDLSSNNVIIDPDTLALRIIDFEGAVEVGVDAQVNMFTPGFGARGRRDRDTVEWRDDHFALGCTMLALVVPNAVMVEMKPEFAEQAFAALQADIGLPQAYADCALYLMRDEPVQLDHALAMLDHVDTRDMHAFPATHVAGAQGDFAAIVAGIVAYNTGVMHLAQASRIFPLGSQVDDPFAVDNGVLGVALGLQRLTGAVPPGLKDWLRDNFRSADHLPGLLNGLSGMAWAFAELDMQGEAQRALRAAGGHRHLYQSSCLGYGAAGYGLANLHLWGQSGDAAFLDEALKIADILCDTAVAQENGVAWDIDGEDGIGVGLNEGASGIALFLLYAHAAKKEPRYLATACKGLDFDIGCGGTAQHMLGFPRRLSSTTRILYPYLGHGSAGVGTVALRMHAVTGEQRYLDVVNSIRSGVAQKYTITGDLMVGLAGLGNYLLDAAHFTGDTSYRDLAVRAADGLMLFAVDRPEGIAFPMSMGSKISCAYASGSTGIALFLDRLQTGGPNFHFMLDALLKRA
jgi:hypothetical protein